MKYSIQEIAGALGVKGKYEIASISHLLTDSRDVFYPKETLFFALKTKNNDGHKFVEELYASGVRNFVVERTLPEWKDFENCNFLIVDSSLKALQKLGAYHRRKFDIPIIGITGSNGKTIVKEWMYQLLQSSFNVTRSPRSYNSQIGVPLSVWQLNKDSEIGIFEAGISDPNEMFDLETIINPTVGVLTNIGDAHQENFKSLKQKCLEKLELFINCDVIICEESDQLIEDCMDTACLSQKRLTWSRKLSNTSALQIKKLKKKESSTVITYLYLGLEFDIEIPFTDDASIDNVTTALLTTLYLGVSPEAILSKLSNLEPVAMRLDVRSGKNNSIIINDSYNSDVNSLKIALNFLYQRATSDKLKRVLILSDILQTEKNSSKLYHDVYNLIVEKQIDQVIGIGNDISTHAELFKKLNSSFYATTSDFIESGAWRKLSDSAILLKGSRAYEFERINELLEGKNHETVLDVNLDAIVHNFNFYRSKIAPSTKMICMVKADGYGSGATEIAKTLQHQKCDYFAVAIAEEGIELRKAGIRTPIIVLNPEVKGFEDLFTYKLEPEVYNFRILNAFIKEAQARGVEEYPIHIKIDTGMHRLGFAGNDIQELLSIIKSQKSLRIQSVFSHLAASESWSFDEFTTQQISTFKKIAFEIELGCHYTVMKHILNSAGIERFPDEQMDMVRLGISLYGVSASGLTGLRNVFTLRSTILQIKDVPKEETVGYGRKGSLDHDAKIATIRIGYADGLNRKLGNHTGKVYVNGHLVPIIGNICMDLCMVDITGIDAKEGDSVIIFGENPTIIDLANNIDTIPYEILTSISSRVKRVYFRE